MREELYKVVSIYVPAKTEENYDGNLCQYSW